MLKPIIKKIVRLMPTSLLRGIDFYIGNECHHRGMRVISDLYAKEVDKESDRAILIDHDYNPDAMTRDELINALANELRDLNFVTSQVTEVYCEITGNRMSKPNYYASDVLSVYEDVMTERIEQEREEARAEGRQEVLSQYSVIPQT